MAKRALYAVGWPVALYFVVFCALTFPWITQFNTHFFCDAGDGLQNIWNLWWIEQATLKLGQLPWFTTLLHYPYGVTLVTHTLNPFNGLLYVPLVQVLSDVQAHNIVVIFSFVSAGLFAFLLCRSCGAEYAASLLGGGLYTFSAYHFAHAVGHLQLVSLEWIPAFVLVFCRLLEKPSIRRALLAALLLLFVILCDYYYFFYCVIFGVLAVGYKIASERDWRPFLAPPYRAPFLCFIAAVLGTSGILVFSLISISKATPLIGTHSADQYSVDLLELIVPGALWRFSNLTAWAWRPRTDGVEFTMNLGLASWAVILWASWEVAKRRLADARVKFWLLVFVVFTALTIGTKVYVHGHAIFGGLTPYALLQRAIPFLKISGMPNRMIVMATLAVAVLVAMLLPRLLRALKLPSWALVGVAALTAVEVLPAPLPSLAMDKPDYVDLLQHRPDHDALIDLVNVPQVSMYFQRFDDRPLYGGYVSRIPVSLATKEADLTHEVEQSHNFARLCETYGFGYILAPKILNLLSFTHGDTELLYDRGGIQLLRLGRGKPCQGTGQG